MQDVEKYQRKEASVRSINSKMGIQARLRRVLREQSAKSDGRSVKARLATEGLKTSVRKEKGGV